MNRCIHFIFLVFMHTTLLAEPPRYVPEELVEKFTLYSRIPLSYWYMDDSCPPAASLIYTQNQINANVDKISREEASYYGCTDHYLYKALEKYKTNIEGKKVAVIGSTLPWYESVALFYGGSPTTIENNKIISEDPRLTTMTMAEYEQCPQLFDAIFSISTVAHDGLGRYGDQVHPFGDIKAMDTMKAMLKEDGLLFLAVPIGEDRLCWNIHRIYGRIRLPLLLQGWKIVDSFGFVDEHLDRKCGISGGHQPVFVLRPNR